MLVTDDIPVRRIWPWLYWANWAFLAAAIVGLAAWIGLASFLGQQLLAGLAFLLGVLAGLGFIVTGYVRQFRVHRMPGHVPFIKPATPARRRASLLVGIVTLIAGIAGGWVHISMLAVVVFVVVGVVLILAQRWS